MKGWVVANIICMNKLKIEDPDNFEFASVVTKESKSRENES